MGLTNIKPYDRFNEYSIGRSNKCDIVAKRTIPKPNEDEKTHSLRKIIYSIISNTHCRIFCLLKGHSSMGAADSTATGNGNGYGYGSTPLDMEVYIEDSSGNGTIVNHTTLLKRNERRILHTGDTICLLNPKIVRKKVKDVTLQKELLDCYSFVFINVYQTHQQQQQQQQQQQLKQQQQQQYKKEPPPGDDTMDGSGGEATVATPFLSKVGIHPIPNRKRGLVDVRATNSRSIQRHTPSSQKAMRSDMPPPEKKHRGSGKGGTNTNINTSTSNGKRRDTRTIEQEYDLREVLGSGTCGQVRRAIHRSSGVAVAVKIIAIGNSGGNRSFGMSKKEEGMIDPTIRAEASILQELNHPYIVKLLDVFIHPGQAVYLVMELLHGGDLFDRIVKKGRYSEVESRRVMRRMLAAVHYLHQERDIVHRDLKPENLLCVSGSDDVTVKLTDFGLAKSITEDGLKTFCGTPLYFAPEVLRRRHTVAGSGRYGKEADMWSLGVILYILICGAPPFDANTIVDDATSSSKISFSGSIWNSTSDNAKDLILKLLTADPRYRISVVDACAHEWIMTPDGDTHVCPLDDPVVLEAAGKIRSKSEEPLKAPKENPSTPVPQSVLRSDTPQHNTAESSSSKERRSGGSSEQVTKPKGNGNGQRKDGTRQRDMTPPPRSMEKLSPNQSANFPTPFKAETRATRVKSKRDPIFSFVKQLPTSNDDISTQNPAGEETSGHVIGKVSDDECRESKINSATADAHIEEVGTDHCSESSPTGQNSTRLEAVGTKTQQKHKGKQMKLANYFDKK